MTWTDERIDELSKLWASGYSASAIGRMLGVSKNAVVGKAHRMRIGIVSTISLSSKYRIPIKI